MPSRLTAVKPEVAMLGADQKERGLWGRECSVTGQSLKRFRHPVTLACVASFPVRFLG